MMYHEVPISRAANRSITSWLAVEGWRYAKLRAIEWWVRKQIGSVKIRPATIDLADEAGLARQTAAQSMVPREWPMNVALV